MARAAESQEPPLQESQKYLQPDEAQLLEELRDVDVIGVPVEAHVGADPAAGNRQHGDP